MRIRELLSWQNIRKKVQDDYVQGSRGLYKYKEPEIPDTTSAGHPGSQTRRIKIVTDEPVSRSLEDALRFDTYSVNLANIIINSTPRFAIGIFGGWGTGKTTLMRMIEKQLENYHDILIVWFDPWKYENEKYLAAIPFIRTIQIEVENKLIELLKEKRPRDRGISFKNAERWNEMRKGLLKALNAFIESTNLNLAMGNYGSVAIDLAKFRDILKSDGQAIQIYNESIYYHHRHIADYLVYALSKFRESKINGNRDPRIVVFIDDLDTCAPERALEVLESLKTFFDIEGFVYVIGMNSETINSIVKKKYGEGFDKGLEYMQKIVQLPFQIPTWKEGWKEEEIADSIIKIISKDLQGSDLLTKFENDQLKKLIVKAVQNPRQVKRFINYVILMQAVFDKLDIDKLIVVQALSFRWKRFLELITPFESRNEFFSGYEKLKNDLKSITNEKDFLEFRDRQKTANPPMFDTINVSFEIYKELVKEDEGKDLLNFLDAGADKTLEEIKEMEDYLIAVASVKGAEENIASQVAEHAAAVATKQAGEKVPPKLLNTIPADGATEVPVTSLVSATFSSPIRSSSITPDNFRVEEDGTHNRIDGNINLKDYNTTIEFKKGGPFDYDMKYWIIIGGVTDLEGIPMTAEKKWYFKTKSKPAA
jgi:hypothetical protein